MSAGTQRSKAERLRRLHQGEAVLVLANALFARAPEGDERRG